MPADFAYELTLVLVNYHSGPALRRFVASYDAHPIVASHEVIVVDNAGDDGVAAWLAAEVPEFVVLSMGSNRGYAGAVNAAIEVARGEHVLVVNPDVELAPRCVDDALRYLRSHPEAGMVGVRLTDPDGSPQHNARRFYTLTSILLRRTPLGRWMPDHPEMRRHLMLDDDFSEPGPVDWLTGAFMLVRREAIERVGGMDERFFLYFEDVDWCARMWERGFEVHLIPEIRLVHEYRRTSLRLSRSLLHHLKSFFSFSGKWGALDYVARRLRPAWSTAAAVIGDLLALNLAFVAAFGVRRMLDPIFPEPLFDLVDYLPLLLGVNAASLVVLPLVGRYRRRNAEGGSARAGIEALRAAFFVTLLVMAGTYLAHTRTFSRAVLLLFVPFYLLALALTGWARTRLLAGGSERRGRRAVVVGRADRLEDWVSELTADGDLHRVAGYVAATDVSGELRRLGDVTQLDRVVDRFRISDLLVDGRLELTAELRTASRELAHAGIEVLVDEPWAAELADPELRVRRWGRAWWRLREPAALGPGSRVKWFLDRVLGLVLFLASLPGYLLCSIVGRPLGLVRARKLRRLGRHRRPFGWTELVDRSGRPLPGIVQGSRLAQLLLGRIGLVGPYPLPLGADSELGSVDSLRFALKPGLAGLWRNRPVDEGLRSYLSSDEDYIAHWSFALEVDQILRWLPRLFRRDDALVAAADFASREGS